jgi:hypothetical protein
MFDAVLWNLIKIWTQGTSTSLLVQKGKKGYMVDNTFIRALMMDGPTYIFAKSYGYPNRFI